MFPDFSDFFWGCTRIFFSEQPLGNLYPKSSRADHDGQSLNRKFELPDIPTVPQNNALTRPSSSQYLNIFRFSSSWNCFEWDQYWTRMRRCTRSVTCSVTKVPKKPRRAGTSSSSSSEPIPTTLTWSDEIYQFHFVKVK